MKQIELKKYGLMELNSKECHEIDGGGSLTKWLKGFSWAYVAHEVADHWAEIKKGLSDGWNIDQPTKPVVK